MKSRFLPFFLMGILTASCSSKLGFDADPNRPAAVETFRLEERILPRRKDFSASTMPWSMVVLSFKTSGRLLEAPFEEGDAIKKGQLLGKLDPVDQYMAHAVAREKLRSLEPDVARVGKLAVQGAIPDAERERILGYRDALATQLGQAAIQLEATVLRAPAEGVIGRKMAHPGEMMDPTKPLGVLLTLDPIKVQVAVREDDLPLFAPGALVHVRIGSRLAEGKVHSVSAAADEVTRTFMVTILVPNPPDAPAPIRVGQLARVEVELPPLKGFFVPADVLEAGTAGMARMLGVVDGKLQVFTVQTHEQEGPFVRITGDFPVPLGVVVDGFSLPARQAVEIRTEWNLETWRTRRNP